MFRMDQAQGARFGWLVPNQAIGGAVPNQAIRGNIECNVNGM